MNNKRSSICFSTIPIVVLIAVPFLGLFTQTAGASEDFPPLTAKDNKIFQDDQLFRVNRMRATLSKQRVANGRPALRQLRESPCLDRAATRWSRELAQNFHHSRADKLTGNYCGHPSTFFGGENIGSYGVCRPPYEDCSLVLFRVFVHSASHYKNMKDPAWNYMGSGAFRDSKGIVYLTQEFVQCHRDCARYNK